MTNKDTVLSSTVLYVDDEQNNLNAFRAAFRREFRVYTAISAEQGLKELKKHPEIKVIIADQRMPEVTGVEFFEKVRFVYPNKIRVILTGYSDISAVIDAINKGQVYRFIDKPWNHEMIRNTVRNAIDIYDTRKRLHDKNISLQKAYKELDKFVYSVSHDLRSPLMSILGIANLAELDVRDPKALEYFKSVKGMVQKLDGYVQDIIKHYKGGQSRKFTDRVDFNGLVNEIIESIKYHPSAQEVRFEVSIHQESEFISNTMYVKAVLGNLISNAFKYQRVEELDKYVKIVGHVGRAIANLKVQDNGIGIKPNEIKKVFGKYVRSKNDETGTGLGLFITKEAIDRLDAKIRLNSKYGEGTSIELSIPNKVVIG